MRLPDRFQIDPARVQQLQAEANALRTDPAAATAQREQLAALRARVEARFTKAKQAWTR